VVRGPSRQDDRGPAPPSRDAGAGDGAASGAPPAPEKKKESISFVSVDQGNKLAESLAPLHAIRRLGRIEDARAAEFGFDKSEGKLLVSISARSTRSSSAARPPAARIAT